MEKKTNKQDSPMTAKEMEALMDDFCLRLEMLLEPIYKELQRINENLNAIDSIKGA